LPLSVAALASVECAGTFSLRSDALTPQGKIFDLAQNISPSDLHEIDDEDFPEPRAAFGASEFSGVCFSPDGKWLFLNVQYPGLTLAISGPWERGVI
jgi:hypothetical protein